MEAVARAVAAAATDIDATAVLVAVAVAPLTFAVLYYLFGPPVSKPGPPMRNRDLRLAKWPAERRTKLEDGWTFLHADESHAYTEKLLGFEEKMTGEPAGRHVWYRKGLEGSAPLREVPGPGAPATTLGSPSALRRLSKLVKSPSKLLFGDEVDGPGREDDTYFTPSENPNVSDKVFRNAQLRKWRAAGKKVPTAAWAPKSAYDSARKGVAFYQALQCEDGHWAGDYGGPHFLLPGLVTVLYISGCDVEHCKREGFIAYIRNHQQVDGGWGTHIEGASTMFGTVLNYTALRLLGVDKDDDACVAGRRLIRENGGALFAPSWAKFWLALLGLYEWRGIASVPPEMWLLPRWFPFHPGKLWCHCRMVYLPMCYLYAKRFTAPMDDTLLSLREELYCEPYASIPWLRHLHSVAPQDNYSPITLIMRLVHYLLVPYELLGGIKALRDAGASFAAEYMHAEDVQTNYVDIGPVNKALNMLSCYVHAGCEVTEPFRRHLQRIDDYLWLSEDGLKMNGYNGSQCWDTSFAIQGIIEGGIAAEFPEMCAKVWSYLDRTQIKVDEDDREHWFRHQSKGGWPFSTAAHGWPISDCTAEGLKAVLCLKHLPQIVERCSPIGRERLCDAADVLLSLQNHDGGWATYENNRVGEYGPVGGFYELLNPSEAFGDIMIDYSYVECSTASLTALIDFQKAVPDYRADEIRRSVRRGLAFLKTIQRDDGSFYGSWGVCFTYGTWFGIRGLTAAGEPRSSACVVKAVKFLLDAQRDNGGWGEFCARSCADKEYSRDGTGLYGEGGSGVVQTAWACLGIMNALMVIEVDAPAPGRIVVGEDVGGMPKQVASDALAALREGIDLLRRRQLPDGNWKQEACTGVFNRSCAITYQQYCNIFPIWALAVYGRFFESDR